MEIVGSSGAGLVRTVNGKNETRKVEIDASLFALPDDKGVCGEDLKWPGQRMARTKVEQTVAGADARPFHRRPDPAAGSSFRLWPEPKSLLGRAIQWRDLPLLPQRRATGRRAAPTMNGPEIERL